MAKPGDWKTEPLPEKHVTIEYGRRFSKVASVDNLHNTALPSFMIITTLCPAQLALAYKQRKAL